MSIKSVIFRAVMLLALTGMSVYADCTRIITTPTVHLDMVIGRVVVPPNAPTGSVIAYREWKLAETGPMYYCTGGINTFVSRVVGSGMQELANNIFSTNIPGIGLRFKRTLGNSGRVVTYPGSLSRGGTPISLAATTFALEVIKIGPITGSGSIASGPYTIYGYGDDAMLTTSLSANALTIVSPSCLVSGGNNQNVEIGSIRQNQLSGRGSFAGGRSFPLELQCSGGVSLSEYTNINMTFDGTLATGTSAAQGVLINDASSSEAAKGVGVQILNSDQTPLEMRKSQWVGRLNDNQTHVIKLKYFARFYQYLDTISAGDVRAHLVFNIDYD